MNRQSYYLKLLSHYSAAIYRDALNMRRSVGAIPLVSLILNLFSHPATSKFFSEREVIIKLIYPERKKYGRGSAEHGWQSRRPSRQAERNEMFKLSDGKLRKWFANVNGNYEIARCVTSKSRILIAPSRCGNWNEKLRDGKTLLSFFLVTSLHCRERIYCRRSPSPCPPPAWRGEKLLLWKSVMMIGLVKTVLTNIVSVSRPNRTKFSKLHSSFANRKQQFSQPAHI